MATKKSKWDKIVVGEMPMTGPVEIDIQLLISLWDDKCWLAEWKSTTPGEHKFRFIRYRRLGQEPTTHKFSISNDTANALIQALGLEQERSIFNSAFSWRKQINLTTPK